MEEKQTNTYTGLDVFQPLRKAQTGKRIDITLTDRQVMDEGIRKNIQDTVSKSVLLDKNYIQQRIDFIISQIHQYVGKGYEKVFSFSTEDSVYRFFDKDSKEIYRANLMNLWNTSNLPPEKLRDIRQKSLKEEQSLKETLGRESLLGGSVIVQYVATASVGGLVGASSVAGMRNTLNGASLVSRKVQSLWIKNPAGIMERIPLGDMIFQGSSDWIKANSLRMLERVGVYFNPVTKTCTNIGAMAISTMLKGLEKITFSEFRKKYGLSISETEFQKFKTQLPEFMNLMKSTGNSVAEMVKWATGRGLHIVMFPAFFVAFQQQPNSATLAAGLVEMVAFNQGAKIGGGVGKYFGPLGRGLGPIVGGVGGVAGAHWVGSKMDADIEKWKIFNGRDMFSSKSSAVVHTATGWGVNEYFDYFNDGGLFHSEEEARAALKGGFDVKIPNIDWGDMLPESWAKKGPLGWLTGGTGVTPEIALYKRNVSFSMNPWEWFNASMKGRTVEKWNIMVDTYQKNLLEDTAILLGKFQGNQYPFNKGTPEEKKKILEDRLKVSLMPVGTSMFQQQANSVILLVLSEVSHWNKDTSIGFVREGISNYISYMRIDDTFRRLNQVKIDAEKHSLQEDFSVFANQLTYTKQKNYVMGLYRRTVSGEPIFEPDTIVADDNPFGYKAHIELSAEHKIFNSLLDSRNELTRETINSSGESTSEKLETRKLFVILLERLSLHAQLISFQKRIKSIDTKENAGEFIEIEAIKKLTK